MKLDVYRKDLYVVDNVFTKDQCREIIAGCVFTRELTNKFGEKFTDLEMRNDRGAITRKTYNLLTKVRKVLPNATSLNPRVRVSKYSVGGRCAAHLDAQYRTSTHSVVVFLNTPTMGGELRFHHRRSHMDVTPLVGRMVIFSQELVHESCEVLAGLKYAMRTDVLMSKAIVRPSIPNERKD